MLDVTTTEAPGSNPLEILENWYREAIAAQAPMPDAMTLATSTADGRPSARIVLFKGVQADGVRFVTNYASRKAQELEQNPRAALVFFWPTLDRQVRLEGEVQRFSDAESDAYFASRPRLSQLGAWASPQSQELGSRAELESRLSEVTERFKTGEVPRPDFWGGYRLNPSRVELWIAGAHRLHDRFVYERTGSLWKVARLAP
jgi:pyridoxamine 5'-phosphate oxidase